MKKWIAVMAIGISSFSFSQTRFVYQVSMKTDSTAAPTVENAYLDSDGKKSFFYGEKQIQIDSLMRRNFQTRNFDRSQFEQFRSKIDYQIDKNLADGKTIFKSRIGRDMYTYEEDRKMDWKILQETTKIDEYIVQKAETEFAGRKWTAWFTQDIALPDGPYKFKGLPGLILKIEDEKGDYSFDLRETKKLSAFPEQNQRGTVMAVKRKDYEKQLKRFQQDPKSIIQNQMQNRGRMGGGGGAGTPQGGGNRPDGATMQQMMKQMEARIKEEAAKNNNPIEK